MASPNSQLTNCDRNLYPLSHESGQRRLGPPIDWFGSPPAKGCEVFVGHLPRDMLEDRLLEFFALVGRVYQIRLMMETSHSNRGFAFVAYSSPDEAQQAVDLFNDFEIQLGHRIGVVISKDNRVLCLRRIPLSTTRNEMLSIMSKLTPGVIQITMQDTGCNGQRAIVEYSQHQAAAKARRYLLSHKLIINGSIASVDWHTSDAESLEDTHLSTTNLFVTNFTPNLSPSHLRDLFSFAGILPIKLIKFSRCGNYAFIHYCTQQQATIAYNAALQDTFFGSLYSKGKRLYVSWAKVTKERVDDSDALTDSHFSSQNSFSSFSSFLQ